MKKISVYVLCLAFCLVISGCGVSDTESVNKGEAEKVNLNEVLNNDQTVPKDEVVEEQKVTESTITLVEDTEEQKVTPTLKIEEKEEQKIEVAPAIKVVEKEEEKTLLVKSELTGEFKKFEAKDVNGNSVNESIISNAELTVLNIWGTFCSPCIEEMPALGELAEEYKDKGVQIVGVISDVASESQISKAKLIIERTKANFLHLIPSEDLQEIYLNKVLYIPETLFIDGTGKIIESKVGSMSKDSWKEIIDSNLEKVKKSEN